MRIYNVLAISTGTILTALLLALSAVPQAVTPRGLKTLEKKENTVKRNTFIDSLPRNFEFPTDDAGELLLREYGAVYVTRGGAVPPPKILFVDEAEVLLFQRSVESESEKIGGINIVLQKAAMRALEAAVKTAAKAGISISPRGADSGRRGYDQTVALWKSRVGPGLIYWVGKGRLKVAEADRIRSLPTRQQVTEILSLERFGIFFARSLDKSIIYSVAPPGTSQHIAMLALDVKEFNDPRVRAILADHGWFQTVVSDLPHFTFLGMKESELPSVGLKVVRSNDRAFWIPDVGSESLQKKGPAATPTPRNRSNP